MVVFFNSTSVTSPQVCDLEELRETKKMRVKLSLNDKVTRISLDKKLAIGGTRIIKE